MSSEVELIEHIAKVYDVDLIKTKGVFKKVSTGKIRKYKVSNQGYLPIGLLRKQYLQHRIVYLVCHGSFPANEIDHINGNKTDNRPENIRDATKSENQRNKQMNTNNTSGVAGVYYLTRPGHVRRWHAEYRDLNGVRYRKAFFTLSEAAQFIEQGHADISNGYTMRHGTSRVES